tara:strand:+ start:2752 stop:3120 length:369 start_codon:yes stop_codon:yes gene_type:complete
VKLQTTLKTLLLEVANRDDACRAIQGRFVTSIYYEGDTTLDPGWRTIEPVAAGTTKKNNPVLRAWQQEGASDTPQRIPGWRFFRLDRIRNFDQTLDTFDEVRPNFNPNGDKSMNQVWCIAKF